MKRIFILLGLFLSVSAMADTVSESRARVAAEAVFGNKVTKSASSSVKLLNPATKSGGGQDLYIYGHDGGGFTIISGDDALSPVLAYSTSGSFQIENMPDNVKCVIEDLENCVRHAREIRMTAGSKTKSQWEEIDKGNFTYASRKVLTTPEYNQTSPFWDNTPKFGGTHTYSGCVATATAEIMKYHNWPEAGSGTIPSYTSSHKDGTKTNTVTMPAITLGHSYDWDNILTYYNSSTGKSNSGTAEQRANAAELLLEIGCAVEMNYGTTGSGTATAKVPIALAKYFGYCGDSYHKSKSGYTVDQWISLIHEAIDKDLPVLYDGESSAGGGHAFVADGYDTDNRININFGWGGSYNGMYTFPEFDEYTLDHGAVFDIRPNKNGEKPVTVSELVMETLTSSASSFSVGTYFDVDAVKVSSQGNTGFVGSFALWHVDGGGNRLTNLKSYSIDLDIGYYYPTLTFSSCRIAKTIAASDVLRAYYKPSGSSDWIPAVCCGEPLGNDFIAIGSNDLLESETSVNFSKSTHTLKVTSDKFASFEIYTASGSVIPTDAYSVSGGVCTIDSSKLTSGKYRMVIKAGIFSKEISFVL